MSKLAVGSIEGLASEGYKITVPSGSKIVQTGAVLQVVQTVKTNVFSTTSTSFIDITGMSNSITPSSASNKVLVLIDMKVGANNVSMHRLMRDSTVIYAGDAAGNRSLGFSETDAAIGAYAVQSQTVMFLDSPATTLSVTYKVQIRTELGTAAYVNQNRSDPDSASLGFRSASSIILMEIAG